MSRNNQSIIDKEMIIFEKEDANTIRLNSYRPLCGTAIGMRAVKEYGCHPFEDGSCRREPDFRSDFPSITTLCRQEKFAPYLRRDDIVIYITTKGKWLTDYSHRRLVAALSVVDYKDNHWKASQWYSDNATTGLPSNCMVEGNEPEPFYKTAGNFSSLTEARAFLDYPLARQQASGSRRVELWNKAYQCKADKNGSFVITEPIYVNLIDPPILLDADLVEIFGKVPNTRNPNIIRDKEIAKALLRHAGVNLIL